MANDPLTMPNRTLLREALGSLLRQEMADIEQRGRWAVSGLSLAMCRREQRWDLSHIG